MMYKPYETTFRNQTLTIREKLANLSFTYLLLIITLAAIGVIMLYSAANGNWQPWAVNQLVRFTIGFGLMLFLALIDIRWLMRYAYLFYFGTLVLLVIVDITGHIGMGAQRWINFGFFKLQPSELMKIAMVLVLARYFHTSSLQTIESTKGIIPPLLMALFPAALIILQPDLGTALMLLFTTGAIFFAVGVQVWKFAVVFIGGLVSMPIAWAFLHDYQRNRVLTFLDPERDPLGPVIILFSPKLRWVPAACLAKVSQRHAEPFEFSAGKTYRLYFYHVVRRIRHDGGGADCGAELFDFGLQLFFCPQKHQLFR